MLTPVPVVPAQNMAGQSPARAQVSDRGIPSLRSPRPTQLCLSQVGNCPGAVERRPIYLRLPRWGTQIERGGGGEGGDHYIGQVRVVAARSGAPWSVPLSLSFDAQSCHLASLDTRDGSFSFAKLILIFLHSSSQRPNAYNSCPAVCRISWQTRLKSSFPFSYMGAH